MKPNMLLPRGSLRKGLRRSFDYLYIFLKMEAAGGVFLFIAAALAMLVANSHWEASYLLFLEIPFSVALGEMHLSKPLLLWINDGLMAVFFLLVGLELKREMVEGHLNSLRKASLPAIAAVGGMIFPAGIYLVFNWHDPLAVPGWGIPTATDIAFALGVLSLLGRRVPMSLKIFLLSIAIFDDLGAIIIIAFFYTASLSISALVVAAFLVTALFLLNRWGVTRLLPYFLLGLPLWLAILQSGIHATIGGVILAMMIPLRTGANAEEEGRGISPLHRLESTLHPWVIFGILPLFAFANAGVPLAGMALGDLWHPVPLGIIVGLLLGKQIGITSFCWLAVKLKISQKGEGITWRQIYGVSVLCGVGFTMSLLISSLASSQGGMCYWGLDRLGILSASFIAGVLGYLVLRCQCKRILE